MPDIFAKNKRSSIMAAIHSSGGAPETIAARLFRRAGIRGWRRQNRRLPGKPDFTFQPERLAIFIDGCFWHQCPSCKRRLMPRSNKAFWIKKLAANVRRDRRVNRELRLLDWHVLRVWEHALRPAVAGRFQKRIGRYLRSWPKPP